MHVSSDRDLVEIKGGTMYYQLDGIFPIKEAHPWRMIYLLQDCAVTSGPSEQCEVGIHMCGSTGPQEKLCKAIKGLEGRGEGL